MWLRRGVHVRRNSRPLSSEYTLDRRVAEVTAPTIILIGEKDVHYLDEADLLAWGIPDVHRFIVKNSGHVISVQAPEVFEDHGDGHH